MTAPSDATEHAMVSMTSVAHVSITVSITTAIAYVEARCPKCQRMLMGVPGPAVLHVVAIATERQASGRGRTIRCKRCKTLCEVIEHRPSVPATAARGAA